MTAPATKKQILLTPGPTQVPPQVLAEMAEPIIHHRTKQFRAIFAEMSQRLQRVFRTHGPVLSITGSGTTAFEAAQISLFKPGTRAITISGGKFAERWQDIYEAYGIPQVKLDVAWGAAVDLERVEQTLRQTPDASVVTVVASETSTATYNDIQAIARLVRKTEALLIVDGITAVGAMPMEQDAWGIDALVTGSQKALMLPPGLGYVGLGPRALERLKQVPPRGYYNLDLRRWLKSYADNDVPFTPAVSLVRAQRVALEMIEHEGLEKVFARTCLLAEAARAAFLAMGLRLISQEPSDSVTGAFYPDGVEDSQFRAALRDKHGIHIAGGQDGRGAKWKSSIFRISHMGYVSAEDTLAGLGAIETELIAAGVAIKVGTAVHAANQILNGR